MKNKFTIGLILIIAVSALAFNYVRAIDISPEEMKALFFQEQTLGATILFPGGGGTGTSTAPTYGKLLVGNAGGTYTLTATSTLGFIFSETDPVWTAVSGNYLLTADAFTQAIASTTFQPIITAGTYDVYGQATSTLTNHATTYNHTNYNTAYGWGDHGTQGYAKYNFGANNFLGTGNFDTTGSINASSSYITALNVDLIAPGRLLIATSTAPDYSYQYDSNTGLGWISNDKQALYTGGTAQLTVDSTGNVGIGTTGPGHKLDVVGNISLNTNGTSALFSTNKAADTDGRNIFIGGGGQSVAYGEPPMLDSGSYNSAMGMYSLYYNTTGSNNTAMGNYALFSNTTGSHNAAMGNYALFSNTTGLQNAAMGNNALYNNTTGYYNAAMGVFALHYNTTGYNNAAMGFGALFSNTTGYQNSAMGNNALHNNTTGYYNAAMGNNALYYNTTGYNNAALGFHAGSYLANGTTANRSSNNSVFLGYNARANLSGGTNEIVIGASAIGEGSNSVVLGNNSITRTLLSGNVGIGTTSPSTLLHVQKDQNSSTEIISVNENTGVAAFADISARNGTTIGDGLTIRAMGTGYTTNGAFVQDAGVLEAGANLSGGFSLLARGASADMRFYTGGFADANERMRILNSGNVGIGTTGPTSKLDVELSTKRTTAYSASNFTTWADVEVRNPLATTDSGAATGIALFSHSTAVGASNSAVGIAAVKSNGTDVGAHMVFITRPQSAVAQERMRITNTGNVGIGTTTPWGKLSITGAGATSATYGLVVADSNNSPKMVVRNDGKVGIGTTGPLAKFTVNGTEDSALLRLESSSAASITLYPTNTREWDLRASSNSDYKLSLTNTAAGRFDLTIDGNVGIGTTTPSYNLTIQGGLWVYGTGTSTIQNNLDVKGTLHATNSYVGDLIFKNGYRFTEKNDDLLLLNKNGKEILHIKDTGEVVGDFNVNTNQVVQRVEADLVNKFKSLNVWQRILYIFRLLF